MTNIFSVAYCGIHYNINVHLVFHSKIKLTGHLFRLLNEPPAFFHLIDCSPSRMANAFGYILLIIIILGFIQIQ